jgi:lysosomal acid lipase/cholesteryl ester hydrolase
VFLQHGLLCSSADWVVLGPGKALGFMLADEGYDVWMGNARGNKNSRYHEWLSPEARAFWDFSWHEIGQFDLPAMIDYVLGQTGQSKLHYAGHSQGTTSFFVMGSIKPEYNNKIITMHALAPVAFMSNLVSPFVRAMSPFVDQVEWVLDMMGVYEFMPSNDMMEKGGYFICRDESPFQEVCANVLFLIGGFNSEQLNRTMIPAILQNTPAGAAVRQLTHYGHGVNSGKFRMYDWGLVENMQRYGSASPPDYNLNQVTARVFLHYGDNDWLAHTRDVDELATKLPNLIGKFRVPHDRWNHLDFTYGNDANYYLYDRIINYIGRYDD